MCLHTLYALLSSISYNITIKSAPLTLKIQSSSFTQKPGKFDYKNIYMPSVSEDTYVISLEELGFAYNQMIYISAHAVVEKQLEDGTIQTETGWYFTFYKAPYPQL
ncbi:hypothetical protein ATZ99_06350 [Thermovenabulum gondwanense]|uniref:Uncharacterized protein n=1 Tax=Thermovenabulum gondwanense TaxID=520767 RepID=A0A162MU78_9FIRM|nr:hypothetical protein ATZ99_06350 [Thermovenabulum gondwanense]